MVVEYLGKPDATIARAARYDLLDSTEGVRQMSWVIDVASSMGIPAGAATLAVSMYAGCSAAEKAARPEALQDIARILKDPSWSRAVRPVSIIERLFRWTFGARQLSWKCVRRSIMATLMFSVSLMMIYSVMWKTELEPFLPIEWAIGWKPMPGTGSVPTIRSELFKLSLGIVLLGCLPDFLAIGKTRVLLRHMTGRVSSGSSYLLVVADITLSALISFSLAATLIILTYEMWSAFPGRMSEELFSTVSGAAVAGDDQLDLVGAAFAAVSHREDMQYPVDEGVVSLSVLVVRTMVSPFFSADHETITFLPIFLASTLLTSAWTTLTLFSTLVVKLVMPLQRFTTWFFDVDRHPVQAIGVVSGVLLMTGSLVWTLVRAAL